jgi:hypothetical protein
MANSSDIILRLMEQPVKQEKDRIRNKVNYYAEEVMKAQEELEEAGFKDTSFAYESVIDENGEKVYTGLLLDPIDWQAYFRALEKKKKDTNEICDSNSKQYYAIMNKWYNENKV